ncbi:AAA family ATPase [Acinetobacter haemolyticus]|uniref:McrB family protein n=1 Tax=Acinetobacter haemolyticus TaxID=29430 RepID=UPI003D214E07
MTSSEKLLELYDEIIVNRYIDEKDAMQEWHDRYKSFIETVQARTVELKKGKKLDYDNGDQEFLDHFFISNNPVSSRGSNPISDEDLRTILRSNEFTGLIEETMLNPNKKSWVTLIEKGKNIFKRSHFDNQPLRFNRISASCTSNLIPMPSENAFNKFVKYLNDNAILDFTNVEKSWYAQNEYLTNKFHEIFNNKILDENDFTDEYWLNLFAWSLYDKKVNQSESDVKDTETKPNTGTKKMENSLNRILFGAAGTGKTFNTINHALSIIEDKSLEKLEKEERRDLKNRFDEYKNKGQIKFVTFHQSFSYEDFVEGIRAETDEQGNLTYKVKSGVFKDICEKATGVSQQAKSIDEIVEKFLDEITEIPLELNTQQNKKFKVSYVGSGVTLQCQPLASEANATYYANISKIKNLLSGEKIDNAYNRSYIKAVAEYLKPKVKPVKRNETNQNYILIIDEINRGSISRIFGELITLIEDSKRAGAHEELSVILPYSKQEFTVPKNVYIIGTMNSSDRSLTGLDIALRRRFTFIEMPPKPEEIKDENGVLIEIYGQDQNGDNTSIKVAELLKVMNQRIEVLLDRDHCIGHANFMSLQKQSTLEHLAHIFKQKIIPQLQEYFFDDWSKISLVLYQNGMIIEDNDINTSTLFPANAQLDIDYSEQKKIWKINDEAFKTIDAFIKIFGTKG